MDLGLSLGQSDSEVFLGTRANRQRRALSKSHYTVYPAWTPAFAGVTLRGRRLVIPAEAGIYPCCTFRRSTLTGPYRQRARG